MASLCSEADVLAACLLMSRSFLHNQAPTWSQAMHCWRVCICGGTYSGYWGRGGSHPPASLAEWGRAGSDWCGDGNNK
eukprot:scaffold152178_cov35-Tisochrysis_lutea.AAC.2